MDNDACAIIECESNAPEFLPLTFCIVVTWVALVERRVVCFDRREHDRSLSPKRAARSEIFAVLHEARFVGYLVVQNHRLCISLMG